MRLMLLRKATGGVPRPPPDPPEPVEQPPWDDRPEQPQVEEPAAPEPVHVAADEPDMRMGSADQIDEARRFATLGKAMRLIDPERLHESHLVGPDLADPHTWRHTLLVDGEPFSDREFDHAEDAFLSALQSGAVPASDDRTTAFDLDQPLDFES
jgi:hypothetical protein